MAGMSRRWLYRECKQVLSRLLRQAWGGPRQSLDPEVRRFLRARPRSYLLRLVGDRASALAAAASLLASGTARAVPPINLSAVAAGNGGFVMNGINPRDYSGHSLSDAGDVNGDGVPDVVVGALSADPAGELSAGQSYVVFGLADGARVDLSDVAGGIGGFVVNGIDAGDRAGRVSGVGDMNGDGLADIVVGANYADPAGFSGAGESYVVFGKADGTPVDLSDVAAGIGGFVINGIDPLDYSGFSVSGAGDVNGDLVPDVIIGARRADPGGQSSAGESYVVFGKADGTPVNLSDVAAGTGGFVINGIDADDQSGVSVSGAGDVNGDGLADVIVGSPFADPGGHSNAGESYVVFGKADGTAVNLSDVVNGLGGFAITGIDEFDSGASASVSDAGDVNGDGLADIIVSAVAADPAGNENAGESYVVFGKADGTTVDLFDVASGIGGFVINGIDPGDLSGAAVSGAGDVNGDGLADLIVSAPFADPGGLSSAGETYVVYGKAGGAPVNLSDAAGGIGGFVIIGIDPGDGSGLGVSGAGDVNGDLMDDLLLGAFRADPAGHTDAGESYVIFSPVLRGDLDDDGSVGIADFLLLLGAWGPCQNPCPPYCPGDLDHDCAVGVVDFLTLLGNWS